jgi:hypothetical protein
MFADDITLDPLASVDLGTYSLIETYSLNGSPNPLDITGLSPDLATDLPTTTSSFDWTSVGTSIVNLLTSWGKVAIADQAEKSALAGQEVSATVQIAQTQAQQSTNLMIGIGIIGGIALISIIMLNR